MTSRQKQIKTLLCAQLGFTGLQEGYFSVLFTSLFILSGFIMLVCVSCGGGNSQGREAWKQRWRTSKLVLSHLGTKVHLF